MCEFNWLVSKRHLLRHSVALHTWVRDISRSSLSLSSNSYDSTFSLWKFQWVDSERVDLEQALIDMDEIGSLQDRALWHFQWVDERVDLKKLLIYVVVHVSECRFTIGCFMVSTRSTASLTEGSRGCSLVGINRIQDGSTEKKCRFKTENSNRYSPANEGGFRRNV